MVLQLIGSFIDGQGFQDYTMMGKITGNIYGLH